MQVKEIIRRKRDGELHTEAELRTLIEGFISGEVKDYQMAAWLMAVFQRGLNAEETTTLTRLMWKSGESFPRTHRDGYWIDKHSTGGVGDKPSLILVPLVTAVCRHKLGRGKVKIPMVSGRGLGHSGGTLDKLESVPGFSPRVSLDRAVHLLEANDYVMMGQTDRLAPADRLLYALRDVTATVECLPLIVSSIMSKKLAESLDGLVFDVKTGIGAFMQTEEKALALAERLVETARANGVDAVAVLTPMDEPLGYNVGNRLEVEECAEFLRGTRREPGLLELNLTLASWMVHLASRRTLSLAQAREACVEALETPVPFQIFTEMFHAQGGDWDAFEQARSSSAERFTFSATSSGYLEQVDAFRIGNLLNALGGGRDRKEDSIDPFVGFEFPKKVGERVQPGEALVHVHHTKGRGLDAAAIRERLDQAVRVGANAFAKPAPVRAIVGE